MRWVLVDETDGLVGDDYADNLRLYGIGSVGATRRVYSVDLLPTGQGLEALRAAVHSSGGIVIGGTTVVTGGPLSTNGSLTGSSALRPLNNVATEVVGSGGTPASAKPMPSAGVFDYYMQKKADVDPGTLAGGIYAPGSISAADNPAGPEDSDGVYYLKLPLGVSNLSVEPARIKATLLIEGPGGGTLIIKAPTYWTPERADLPILIAKGFQNVRFLGSIAPQGSNPSELAGLIHLIGRPTSIWKTPPSSAVA
jgi:hypothetical protein